MMLISFFGALFLTCFFPESKLHFFIPFLTLSVLKKKPLLALWSGALIGAFEDLLSQNEIFPLTSLTFTLNTLLLILIKQFFVTERKEIPLLMCALFSFAESTETLLFTKPLHFSVGTELFLLPFIETSLFIPFSFPFPILKKALIKFMSRRKSDRSLELN